MQQGMQARRSLGTIIGMIIFAAIILSAIGLLALATYQVQRISTALTNHNARVSEAVEASKAICSAWTYSPSLHLLVINITNRSPRPAGLIGVMLLYSSASFKAFNESRIIPPGGSIAVSTYSHGEPVSIILTLLIDGVAVRSSCIER